MRGRFALVGIWMILSGCSYLAQSMSGIGRESAVEYFDRVTSASEAERQAELQSLRSLAETQSSVTLAAKVGLLAKVWEGANAEDETYALSMLAILDEGTEIFAAERDYYQLGLLVRELLIRRQQMDQAEFVRADLQRQIDTLNTNNQLLQSQIEALKNIETQINERQQQENGDEASSN